MADRKASDLRRRLDLAERARERAIRLGLDDLKTSGWRSSASLFCLTSADHFLVRLRWAKSASFRSRWRTRDQRARDRKPARLNDKAR